MARAPSPDRARARLFALLTGDPKAARKWAAGQRKRGDTFARKARKEGEEARARARKAERARSGLRKRAADILLDLIDRVIPPQDWEIESERLNRGVARATATGFPMEPTGMVVEALYNRTVRALTIAKKDLLRVKAREAGVRCCRVHTSPSGKVSDVWETLVSLVQDPHGLIQTFDLAWEKLPDEARRGDDPSYSGPVYRIQVYFVEHER